MGLTQYHKRLVASAALLTAGFLFAGTSPLAAQGGIQVPAVAPTAADDSLYKLAVDPAAHEGEPTHALVDATTVRVEPDGSVVKTFRRVIQILTEAGASRLREQQFGYVPGHQSFTVHW
ncbi:MAG: DUF3857 domain-containing protein, partial [Gemmatimonadota bacterium]|nr:DUF3857 domain-containing protein [Gemmatimonadota bacterium]